MLTQSYISLVILTFAFSSR